jgi:hypothetical protein
MMILVVDVDPIQGGHVLPESDLGGSHLEGESRWWEHVGCVDLVFYLKLQQKIRQQFNGRVNRLAAWCPYLY